MILTNCSNLYEEMDIPNKGELFTTLLEGKNITIKRIVSSEHIDHEIMIQEEDEWFIMIEGEATIMIEEQKRDLKRGDYCFIAAKTAHRLLSIKRGTVWLAVHFLSE